MDHLEYLAAIGRKGGKILSPRKLRALKRIAKLPRPGARKPKPVAQKVTQQES